MDIKGFFGEYFWLSNFYVISMMWDGRTYPSTEAAYQSAKTLNIPKREEFIYYNPRKSKREGRKLSLRYDWEDVKDQVMYEVCKSKFTVHRYLREKLIETGDVYLEETNHWGDTYWGVCDGNCNKECEHGGTNKLGHTLMRIRKEIQNGDY